MHCFQARPKVYYGRSDCQGHGHIPEPAVPLQALLHRAATGRPLSLLKYAMTADGKIACSSGHSSWVSCPDSRKLVFEARARSDAIIVGGNTVSILPLNCLLLVSSLVLQQ